MKIPKQTNNGEKWVDYYDDHMIELGKDKVKYPNVDIVRIMKVTIETTKKTSKYDKA